MMRRKKRSRLQNLMIQDLSTVHARLDSVLEQLDTVMGTARERAEDIGELNRQVEDLEHDFAALQARFRSHFDTLDLRFVRHSSQMANHQAHQINHQIACAERHDQLQEQYNQLQERHDQLQKQYNQLQKAVEDPT